MSKDKIKLAKPRKKVQISLPDRRVYEGPVGSRLSEFLDVAFPDPEVPYITALVDGELRELTYDIARDCVVEPIDLSESDGVRIYRRSLTFLMVAAAQRVFPGVEIFIDHSLPFGGYFCEVRNRAPLDDDELQKLSDEMQRMVAANYPIMRESESLEDALVLFARRNEMDKVAIFQGRDRKRKAYLRLYSLDGYRDYLHGYMVPSTGYLKFFQLLRWEDGFILQFPRRHQPTQFQDPHQNPQLLTVFREYGRWLRLLGVECVGDLNWLVERDKLRRVVLVSEALHEHRIAQIARQIGERRDRVRVVLIAGPSSSGKTTFSNAWVCNCWRRDCDRTRWSWTTTSSTVTTPPAMKTANSILKHWKRWMSSFSIRTSKRCCGATRWRCPNTISTPANVSLAKS